MLDGWLTYFLLSHGLGYETNPLFNPLIADGTFLAFKTCGGILVVVLSWYIYRRRPKLVLICTSLFLVMYVFVVGWNLMVFISSGRV